MQTANTYKGETAAYWHLLKNLSDEVKLRLITLLSQSMTIDSKKKEKSDEEATKEFLAKFYGAWRGDMSAEDLIAEIRKNRTCREPISFD
ncbi:MAG: hypothetical protein K2I44_03375 [Muribaculaceae bacterium]|nr:hypothetical protein [Muribaculaceae bacterium]